MTKKRVNEIDLLRFIAAITVVIHHYTFRGYTADNMSIMPYPLLAPYSMYGNLGVELFFIISGFVILMTASNGSVRTFVTSRLVRLYPAFWACCTITFLVTIAIGLPRYSVDITQYLINMTMLNGFVDVHSIDGVYWSLFEEIRFYFLVLIVLLMGKIDKAQGLLILWLVASIILIPIEDKLSHFWKWRFHNTLILNYSGLFIAGATYFLIWSKGLSITRVLMLIGSWGLAVFCAISRMHGDEIHFHTQMNGYVVVAIITSFFFIMLLVSLSCTGFIGRKNWQVVGALTYPLYLLHQNIGFMIFNKAYPTLNPHLLVWGTTILAIVSAYAVHLFIEKPFSRIMKNTINKCVDLAAKRIKSPLSVG